MAAQEFKTTEVLRFEVETAPQGLVNLVQNPSGELGGWGWITPVVGTTMEGAFNPVLHLFQLTYRCLAAVPNWFTSEAMPIVAGEYAAARWDTFANDSFGWYRARFEWLDEAGVVLSSSAQTPYIQATTGEGALDPVAAPAGAAYVRLRFDLYSTNAGANTGAVLLTFGRATVATAASAAEFTLVRTNLIQNPSFEASVNTGWSATNTSRDQVTEPAPPAGAGLACCRLGANATQDRTISTLATGIEAGATYAFQAQVRAETIARQIRLELVWLDAAAAVLSTSSTVYDGETATGWTRASLVGQAPNGATSARVRLTVIAAAKSEYHYVDAVQLEKSTQVESYFDGSTPDAGTWDYAWTGTPNDSPSTATTSLLQYIPPIEFFDVLPESHQVRITREGLSVGTANATIYSTALDPSQSDLIRPGRRVRPLVRIGDTWTPLFTGTALEAEVQYEVKDPKLGDHKRARVDLSAVDAAQELSNTKRPEGVGTIAELPYVLEGAGVPWNVNGSGNQVPTAEVTTYNENASALDQVALTRDTRLGYAWRDRFGVLNVWDRGSMPADVPLVLDESAYSDLDLSFSTKDCINELSITVQSAGVGGDTVETVYGPFRDSASIKEWGRYRKDFTVTGLDSAQVEALAATILAANGTPRVRVNSVRIPLTTLARLEAYALVEPYRRVQVINTEKALDDVLRVTGIEHEIDTEKWMLILTFSEENGVATPTVQPPVQASARPDVGVIELFAGPLDKLPATKLRCDGSSLAVADWPHLFNVIGYTFGGSGAFFNLPNLTDRFPIGAGTKALGTIGGSATKVIAAGNLPPHKHTGMTIGATAIRWIADQFSAGTTRNGLQPGTGADPVTGDGPGTSQPLDVMNPWLAVYYVIRAA